MSQVETPVGASGRTAASSPEKKSTSGAHAVGVYPGHPSAEEAVQTLVNEGFDMKDVSIVGRDFLMTEEPIGFVTTSDFATMGAGAGAWAGGLFGLLLGAAFLVLPGVGPVVVAGPIAAAVLGGVEGALAGAAVGALSGALIGWGVPRNEALKYEGQVKSGKFLVLVHGTPASVRTAKTLLSTAKHERVDVYENAQV